MLRLSAPSHCRAKILVPAKMLNRCGLLFSLRKLSVRVCNIHGKCVKWEWSFRTVFLKSPDFHRIAARNKTARWKYDKNDINADGRTEEMRFFKVQAHTHGGVRWVLSHSKGTVRNWPEHSCAPVCGQSLRSSLHFVWIRIGTFRTDFGDGVYRYFRHFWKEKE